MASRHIVKRLIRYSDDAQAINGHIQTISWSIESFTVNLPSHIRPASSVIYMVWHQVETMLAVEFALDVSVAFSNAIYLKFMYPLGATTCND